MKPLILLSIVSVLSVTVFAQKPSYNEYAVRLEKKTAKVVNLKSNPKANEFQTNLKNALANNQINFAGKYILKHWGCGTACVQAALIDAQTGEVYFPEILQGIIQGYNEAFAKHEILEFKKNSKLLIIYGVAGNDFKEDSNNFSQGISYYEWTGKDFQLLKFTQID